MDHWQRSYGAAALFLCVCVESPRVAREFSRSFYKAATNCYVDQWSGAFPAQLGCSGFIVLDGEGRFLTTKSPAFLDQRERAFRAVERLLAPLLEKGGPVEDATRAFAEGAAVEITGVSNPFYEGARGTVVETPRDVGRKGRVAVELADGRVIAIRAANLALVDGEAADKEAPDTDDVAVNLAPLPKVGHAEMDDEHAEITAALCRLAEAKTAAAVRAVRAQFEEHSLHEEALMAEVGFGGDGPLSAAASHQKDHRRIVALADAIAAKGDAVADADVAALADAIHSHAANFDVLYVDAVKKGPVLTSC